MAAKIMLSGAVAAIAVLGLAAANSGYAQDEQTAPYYHGYGMGMGPGMMGGAGPAGQGRWADRDNTYWGGMGGYGMMGPGMMYGHGPMMGPGFMHGYGYGFGPGMLNLNESQQKKITAIRDELRKKHWDLMGKMNDEYAKLRDLYMAEKRNPETIGKQLDRIFALRRQMMVDSVKAQNSMEGELTDEQKQQLRNSSGPGWMMR